MKSRFILITLALLILVSISYGVESSPSVSIETLYPTTDVRIIKDQFFNVSLNVSCSNDDCGDVNVTAFRKGGERDREAGTVVSDGSSWVTVYTDNSYENPIVFATPNTENGGGSSHLAKVRNVKSDSFEVKFCEHDDTDGGCDAHASEEVGYFVFEKDYLDSLEGIEAGTTVLGTSSDSSGESKTMSLDENFGSNAIVVATQQTYNEAGESIVQVPSTSTSSFDMYLCDHNEGSDNCESHGDETVAWLAVDSNANLDFIEHGLTGGIGDSGWETQYFGKSYEESPVIIATINSNNGGEEAKPARVRSVSTSQADVGYCEHDSGDSCDGHATENIGWIAIRDETVSGRTTIPTTSSGTPFYTNKSNNPYKINLISGENKQVKFDLNATGELYESYEIFAHTEMVSNTSESDETDKNSVKIVKEKEPPIVEITSPENKTYQERIRSLNYTISELNPDKCWYSTDGGNTNSSPKDAGKNFLVTSSQGENTWTVWCSDDSGNVGKDEVTFTIPSVSVETLYPKGDIEIDQHDMFNVSLNFSCDDLDCGDVNMALLEKIPETNFLEGFESGNLDYWSVNNGNMNINPGGDVRTGSYSAGSWGDGTINSRTTVCEGGCNPTHAEFYWYEDSGQSGFSSSFLDSSGNRVVSAGSNNPQWELEDGSGSPQIYGGDGYNRWIYYSFDFDWDNCDYDYYFKDTHSGHVETGTRSLDSCQGIEKFRISDYNFGVSADKIVFDDIFFERVIPPYFENISSSIGQKPFYTNKSNNPYTVNLDSGQNKEMKFWVNATGDVGLNREFISYINLTSDLTISDETEKWNVTIKDFTKPRVNITYPENKEYNKKIRSLNYTISELNPDKCWYSTDGGNTNSSPVEAGEDFSLTSVQGENTWTVWCNDTSGNVGKDEVTFTIPSVSIETLYPRESINITQHEMFNVSFNVSCGDVDCGDLNVSSSTPSLGDGSDGSLTVSSSGTVVNDYTYITGDESSGSQSIVVNDVSGFSSGDELLILQVQNSSGGIAGQYEFIDVSSIDGNQIILKKRLDNDYYSGSFDSTSATATQVVRVPQYTDVTIQDGASITAPAWNGYTGGIVALRTKGTVEVQGNGKIDVSEKGFRGGDCNGCGNNNWGDQGEGYLGLGTRTTSRNANGAGGASPEWGGGPAGGGGYGTPGEPSSGADDGNEGEGGLSVGDKKLNKMFFGGGGGAGSDNDGNTPYPQYEAGGGIAFISANDIIGASIYSNGEDGFSPDTYGAGCSGGGAGGTIWLRALEMEIEAANALGGKSASAENEDDISGAGGDGRIRLDYDTISGNTSPSIGYNGSVVGKINNNTYGTPFYTNKSIYPYTVNLVSGENKKVTFWLNATGHAPDNYELLSYVNLTLDPAISETEKWNVTIKDFTKPVVNITSPENKEYNKKIRSLNYTLKEENPNVCWYSTDRGETNSSPIEAGENISITSTQGKNTWTLWCSDGAGNIGKDEVTFTIPSVSVETLFPSQDIKVDRHDMFNISVDVSCDDVDCGDVNVTLLREDPKIEFFEGFESGNLDDWSVNNGNMNINPGGDVRTGSYSAGSWSDGTINSRTTICEGGCKPTHAEFYWNEDNSQTGFSSSFLDSDGNRVISSGSNNPQWELEDGSGSSPIYGGDGYNRWIYYSFDFDWDNCDYDYYFKDTQSGHVETGTRSLDSCQDIEKFSISSNYWGSADYVVFDDIYVKIDPYFIETISTSAGEKPFYTNKLNNPSIVNLVSGENKEVTFGVNATGDFGLNSKIFTYTNLTSDMSISSQTSKFNVTIKDLPEVDSFDKYLVTDFRLEENLSNVTDMKLGKGNSYVSWNGSINAEGEDYDSNIDMEEGFVSINASSLDDSINSSAKINFSVEGCNEWYIYYSEEESIKSLSELKKSGRVVADHNSNCTEYCSNAVCSDARLSYNVPHFSSTGGKGIKNYPPEIKSVDVDPKEPISGENFSVKVTTSDESSQNITCNLSGFLNGSKTNTTSVSEKTFDYGFNKESLGDHSFNVTCSDGINISRENYSLEVVKDKPYMNLSLNDKNDNIYISPGEEVKISGNLNNPNSGILKLYKEDNLLSEIDGNSLSVRSKNFFINKSYDITLYFPSQKNYSSASQTYFVTVGTDNAPPTIDLKDVGDSDWTNNNDVEFTYELEDNFFKPMEYCEIYVDGVKEKELSDVPLGINTVTIDNVTEENVSTSLNHTWKVYCKDEAGNEKETPQSQFHIEKNNPSFEIHDPLPGDLIRDLTPEITLTAEDDLSPQLKYEIFVDGNFNSIGRGLDNGVSEMISLDKTTEGNHEITVEISDLAGNSVNKTLDVTLLRERLVLLDPPHNRKVTNRARPVTFKIIQNETDPAECSVYLDGKLKNSSLEVPLNENYSIELGEFSRGYGHNWSVSCSSNGVDFDELNYYKGDFSAPDFYFSSYWDYSSNIIYGDTNYSEEGMTFYFTFEEDLPQDVDVEMVHNFTGEFKKEELDCDTMVPMSSSFNGLGKGNLGGRCHTDRVLYPGNYFYYYNVSNSFGLINTTKEYHINLTKSEPTIELESEAPNAHVNDETWSYLNSTYVEVTCKSVENEPKVSLYRDDVLLGTGDKVMDTIEEGVDDYDYVCNSSGTDNFHPAENKSTLSIYKRGDIKHLYINGRDRDVNLDYDTRVKLNATSKSDTETLLDSFGDELPDPYISYFDLGTYNFTVTSEGSESYESLPPLTHQLTISKGKPALNLSVSPDNWSDYHSDEPWWPETFYNGNNYTVLCYINHSQRGSDQFTINLYEDGNHMGTDPDEIVLKRNYSLSTHNYTCNVSSTENFTSFESKDEIDVVEKKVPSMNVITEPSEVSNNGWIYGKGQELSLNCSDPNDEQTPTLLMDGVEKSQPYVNSFTEDFNVSCRVNESYSYQSREITHMVDIRNSTHCNLTFDYLGNGPYLNATQNFTANCECNNPEASEQLYRDGNEISSEIGENNSLLRGSYEYKCYSPITTYYYNSSNISELNVVGLTPDHSLFIDSLPSDTDMSPEEMFNVSSSMTEPSRGDLEIYYKLFGAFPSKPVDLKDVNEEFEGDKRYYAFWTSSNHPPRYESTIVDSNNVSNISRLFESGEVVGDMEIYSHYKGDEVYAPKTVTHTIHIQDIQKPHIDISYAKENDFVDTTSYDFNFDVEDNYDNFTNCKIYIDGELRTDKDYDTRFSSQHVDGEYSVWASADKDYTETYSLTEGVHNVEISCEDDSDNVNTTDFDVKIDTTSPELEIKSPSNDSLLYDGTPEFLVNLSDDLSSSLNHTFYLDGEEFYDGKVSEGVSEITLPFISPGKYNLTLKATDMAGNSNNISGFEFEMSPTLLMIEKPEDGAKLSSKPLDVSFNYVSDKLEKMNCSVYLNSNLEKDFGEVNVNQTYTHSITNISDNLDHNLSVNCSGGDITRSDTSNFVLDANPPEIINHSVIPPSGTGISGFYEPVNFIANVSENLGIKNATLRIYDGDNYTDHKLECDEDICNRTVNLTLGVYDYRFLIRDHADNLAPDSYKEYQLRPNVEFLLNDKDSDLTVEEGERFKITLNYLNSLNGSVYLYDDHDLIYSYDGKSSTTYNTYYSQGEHELRADFVTDVEDLQFSLYHDVIVAGGVLDYVSPTPSNNSEVYNSSFVFNVTSSISLSDADLILNDTTNDSMNVDDDNAHINKTFTSGGDYTFRVEGETIYGSNISTDPRRISVIFCEDNDGDGYGVGNTAPCEYEVEDCDDTNSSIRPNRSEILGNEIDENCDGYYNKDHYNFEFDYTQLNDGRYHHGDYVGYYVKLRRNQERYNLPDHSFHDELSTDFVNITEGVFNLTKEDSILSSKTDSSLVKLDDNLYYGEFSTEGFGNKTCSPGEPCIDISAKGVRGDKRFLQDAKNEEFLNGTPPNFTSDNDYIVKTDSPSNYTVEDLSIRREGKGMINWTGMRLNLGDRKINVSDAILIREGLVSVSSEDWPELSNPRDVPTVDKDHLSRLTINDVDCSALDAKKIYHLNTSTSQRGEVVFGGRECTPSTNPSCTNITCTDNNLSFNVDSLSSYALSYNSQLEIWDDKEGSVYSPGEITTFYANYTTSEGNVISDSDCNITFWDGSTYNMVKESLSSSIYTYDYAVPSSSGTYNWSVYCYSPDYDNINLTDDLTVGTQSSGEVIPEYDIFGLVMIIIFVMLGYYFINLRRKR